MTNTKLNIFLTIIVPFLTFGQDKFVGEFKRVMDLKDTLENPPVEYVYNRVFKINADHTFTFYEEQNPIAFEKTPKEIVEGSWKAYGDTIFFYNKNFEKPKGIVLNYKTDQKFKGIKIVAKDKNNKPLEIETCHIDSISSPKGIILSYVPYKTTSKNTVEIPNRNTTKVYFRLKGYCQDWHACDVDIDLADIKSGTLIELAMHSTQIEIEFNSKQYILHRNLLHEVSTSCIMPDAWTDNFIKKK